MIDWSARIDDLMHTLQRQEAIDDRVGIEVLLSALIKCPRTPTVWLIVETCWYNRACHEAWFSLGQLWAPANMVLMNNQFSGIDAMIQEWTDNPDEPHLFVEPCFNGYPPRGFVPPFMSRCPRVRIRVPRAPTALWKLDQREALRQQAELAVCVRHVIEDPVQARPANPPKFIEPPDFFYYAELIEKLAPWYPDWRQVVMGLGALAVRHAYIYGRSETGQEEHDMLARVMMDMVPSWVGRGLRVLLDVKTAKFQPLEMAMCLEQKNSKSIYGAHYELKRLRRTGILELGSDVRWTIASQHRRGVERLLEGRMFNARLAKSA